MAARWEFGIPFFSRTRGTRQHCRRVRHAYLELAVMAAMLVAMFVASVNGLAFQAEVRDHVDEARQLGLDALPSIFDNVPPRGEAPEPLRQFIRDAQDTESGAVLTDLFFAAALVLFLLFAARGFERTMANLDIFGALAPRWWKWRMLLPWFVPLLGLRTTHRIVGWSLARAWSKTGEDQTAPLPDRVPGTPAVIVMLWTLAMAVLWLFNPLTLLLIPSGDLEGRLNRVAATEWSYYTMLIAPVLTLLLLLAAVVKVHLRQRRVAMT